MNPKGSGSYECSLSQWTSERGVRNRRAVFDSVVDVLV